MDKKRVKFVAGSIKFPFKWLHTLSFPSNHRPRQLINSIKHHSMETYIDTDRDSYT